MRPELRKTSYLRNLKAEILKEAGGADLPEDFDIKTALEDIYGNDADKDGLIADVSAIQTVMAEEPENGGVIANILDWRTNGVRKDDLAGDTYVIDDSTGEVDGSPDTYQIPDGTSIVTIDWEDIAAEITLLHPDEAPSVILITHSGDYMEKVLHWDSDTLSVCPMNLLIRNGETDWVQIPLSTAFEYRMKNDELVIDSAEASGSITVPDGTGLVSVDTAGGDITLIPPDWGPQIIAISNLTEHKITWGATGAGGALLELNGAGLLVLAQAGGYWAQLSLDPGG